MEQEMVVMVGVETATKFFYKKFVCDTVIDGHDVVKAGTAVDGRKLVLVKNKKTVAVFNKWSFWHVVDTETKQ